MPIPLLEIGILFSIARSNPLLTRTPKAAIKLFWLRFEIIFHLPLHFETVSGRSAIPTSDGFENFHRLI
jgi:hypothetical protein